MNTEIANRLCAYRKHHGLSQEELADRIGVSRQAISKWERTEASPDTDNLIRLSQIYGVTLDDLLYTDPGAKTEAESPEEAPQEDHISIKNGIHIHSKDGDRVDIDHTGIHIIEGSEYDEDEEEERYFEQCKKEIPWYRTWSKFPFPVVCVIAYLLMGFLIPGTWGWGWIVFLTIPLYYTLGEAIVSKNPHHFAYPVLVVIVYLCLGFFAKLWHPGWLVFLTIPLYYTLFKGSKDPE